MRKNAEIVPASFSLYILSFVLSMQNGFLHRNDFPYNESLCRTFSYFGIYNVGLHRNKPKDLLKFHKKGAFCMDLTGSDVCIMELAAVRGKNILEQSI